MVWNAGPKTFSLRNSSEAAYATLAVPVGLLLDEEDDGEELLLLLLLQAARTSPAVAAATSGQARRARAADPVFNMMRQ